MVNILPSLKTLILFTYKNLHKWMWWKSSPCAKRNSHYKNPCILDHVRRWVYLQPKNQISNNFFHDRNDVFVMFKIQSDKLVLIRLPFIITLPTLAQKFCRKDLSYMENLAGGKLFRWEWEADGNSELREKQAMAAIEGLLWNAGHGENANHRSLQSWSNVATAYVLGFWLNHKP